MRFCVTSVIAALLALTAAACGSSPAAPGSMAVIPAGTHQSAITALTGSGAGGVSVTPKSIAAATMDVDISINLDMARPNTTYFVQRAPEVGRALESDGVCQRALGLSPWSATDPAAPAFITFPMPNAGPSVTMTTSALGRASLTFEYFSPTLSAGTLFDVMFRLVDNESAPTTELRSGCFTVTVK